MMLEESETSAPEPTRVCKICSGEFVLSKFPTYKRGDLVRYLWRCKVCLRTLERERQRRLIAQNREKHNARISRNKKKRYHEDEAYREKVKAESRAYYAEHREQVCERIREHAHQDDFRPRIRTFREDDDVFALKEFSDRPWASDLE